MLENVSISKAFSLATDHHLKEYPNIIHGKKAGANQQVSKVMS
jgi:hypothetical protein